MLLQTEALALLLTLYQDLIPYQVHTAALISTQIQTLTKERYNCPCTPNCPQTTLATMSELEKSESKAQGPDTPVVDIENASSAFIDAVAEKSYGKHLVSSKSCLRIPLLILLSQSENLIYSFSHSCH
jgi:hypothetical protein